MTIEEAGSPNRREEGSNAGCLTLQSGEEVTEQMTELKKRVEVSEQKIKLLEKPAKNATTKAPVKAPAKAPVKAPVKNDTDVFYCEFCKTVKATKKGKKYSKTLEKIIQRYRCPKCGVWFKVDERGNSADVKRNKAVVQRIEQLKAEQQRTRPKPGTPSAPV